MKRNEPWGLKREKELENEKEQKLRRVFLTWNNWQKDFETKEKAYDYFKELPHMKAFILGFEVGEQGTEHIQAVVQFTTQKI